MIACRTGKHTVYLQADVREVFQLWMQNTEDILGMLRISLTIH